MKISEKIKEIRNELKINQSQFSHLIGVTQSTISKYERGDRDPEYLFFVNLFQKLKVNPCYIFLDLKPIFMPNINPSEETLNVLQELRLVMPEQSLNEALIHLFTQNILDKFQRQEQGVIYDILKVLKLDKPFMASPFLFLYYIFKKIEKDLSGGQQDIKNYKNYLTSIVNSYNIVSISNVALFTNKNKNEITAIIDVKLNEEECKALVLNYSSTLVKLEEKMPAPMLKAHRDINLAALFSSEK
ncbi:MAG: hypothetical protein A2540_07140 [Sulfurimonas sp. RIFOXYD2_FULL_37_8]|nr:MAG: hypothetical protein A2540_07140 [Sulfurimonas sp. RIFOXYD2_FULL_37_8]